MTRRLLSGSAVAAAALFVSSCGFSPYDIPLPGGADLGSNPYTVKVQFRDVLDLVPQSGVRVNDLAVGRVDDIKLKGWTALVTLKINGDAALPDNAIATIRQTSLLGEKFVSLEPPAKGATGRLSDGDFIPLERSGRNPEIEEVLGAASLLFNGGGLEKTNTIVKELNKTLDGNEPEIKQFITTANTTLTQLDDNKQQLLAALEKVDRLAKATNQQKSAITGALDNLPQALRVVNAQRDDLVALLQALDKLSQSATTVIRDSKADTVANLESLRPILRNVTAAADNLVRTFSTIGTFPFPDGYVGNSLAKASVNCGKATSANRPIACPGDYTNLSISIDIDAQQLDTILGSNLSELGGGAGQAPPTGGLPADQLVQLVEGLVPSLTTVPAPPKLPGLTGSGDKPGSNSTGDGSSSGTDGLQLPSFCSLLGSCRAAASSGPVPDTDFARLMILPAVTS